MNDNYSTEFRPLEGLLPRDVASNSERLMRTRWVAGLLVLLATAFCVHILNLALAEGPLYVLGMAILAYNALLAWLTRRAYTPDDALYLQRIARLVVWQIMLDWLSMAVFLHLTGGVTSPAIAFFFLHVLMVTILLPGQSPYIYVVLAVGVVLLIAVLEGSGALPHYTVIPGMPDNLHTNRLYILAQIIFFAVALFATVFLTASVMARLRARERQISALFQTTQAVSSTLELSDVMHRLAYSAAQALSAPKASIRLLDPKGERLTIAASFGLSQAYLEKGPVELSQSQLDRQALTGSAVIVRHAAEDPRIQYPREVAEEGINSMLVVPITGRKPLGVLRVYSDQAERFNNEDASFVMAIAHQGAVAIENAMAHDALYKAEQQRNQFVRIVTHELRSPVTGSQSLLRVLLRDLVGELTPQQRDIISRLENRLNALMELINDLLALATSKAIDLQQTPAPIPLQPTLQYVLDRYANQASEKHIEFTSNIPEEQLVIRATEDGLSRILDNLIGNAIKYTPQGGQVSVQVDEQRPNAVITVCDTGIGIPQESIEKLGEEFYRAPNARESGIMGTGLGMAIVKQLIDYFGGWISVQSEVGHGTTFIVTLPLTKQSEPA